MTPLLGFFSLTFAASWTVFIAVAALTQWVPPAVQQQLFLPGVFAPALVAIWLTRRAEGSAGVDALLQGLTKWRVGARWYLLAVGYMLAVKLAVALTHRVWVGEWPALGSPPWLLLLVGIAFSLPFQAGEEIGWRGYALPRLAARLGLARASLLLGVIWALWHLPFFFVANADTFGQSLTLYTIQVTAISVAMAWLYTRTGGSLLLVMLMHSAINNTKSVMPSTPRVPANILTLDASLLSWLVAAFLWTAAAYFLLRMRGKPAGEALQLPADPVPSAAR